MTTSLLIAAGIIMVLILLNAFFSLAETALTARLARAHGDVGARRR